jgi:SPP1 family predicted phage head-tail adaptor
VVDVEAGRLRHLISIQQQTTTQDSYGEAVNTWTDVYANIWASVEPLQGREFFSGEKFQSEITHRIRMRYKSGLLPKQRVKFGTRYFYVTDIINPQERNKELQLMAKELI